MDLRAAVKELIARNPTADRWAKLYLLRQRSHSSGHPNWPVLLHQDQERWARARALAQGGPRVLLATNVGGFFPGATLESLLGVALTLRGAEVQVSLCDAALPACMLAHRGYYPSTKRFVRQGPRDLCGSCFAPASAQYGALGFPVHRLSQQLTVADQELARQLAMETPLAAIPEFTLDELAVGEHALAGTLRFFARADLRDEPDGEPILRRYFHAAILSAVGTRRLVEREQFAAAVFHHGIYVPQGLVGEVCRRAGVRVINWNAAYRKQSFIFSHCDTYHHTLLDEPTAVWEGMPWTATMEADIMRYLKSRWQGTEDWIWFHERPQLDLAAIAQEIGIDFTKPTIGLLTNVMWDAQLHYPANAFPSLLDWVLESIRYFAQRPELQLLIRVHPAEIRGTLPSRQPIVAEIQRAFPVLPPNVFVIPPESPVSTYAAMLECDTVVIFGTKTGVELTSMGIPVIVAGEAWIRNKGLTMDALSKEHYIQLLDALPLGRRMSADAVRRSRMYAYHFFFRRMIPLEFMRPAVGDPPYQVSFDRLEDLLPGRSPGLDVICEGILRGTPFVFPAESLSGEQPDDR
jgi:hypothetical protein